MFEIAGGILLAVFVLVFFRVFLALGILLVGCILIGLLIYFFNLEWFLQVFKSLLTNPVLWGVSGLALVGHLMFKKMDKIEERVQANHTLLYGLQQLKEKIKTQEIDFQMAPKKHMLYRHYHEVDIGNFWIAYEKYQYTFSKHIFDPRIKILNSNREELFSIAGTDTNANDKLSYIPKKTEFDYELLGKEIEAYLASCKPRDE
jgi:hypothetical protein